MTYFDIEKKAFQIDLSKPIRNKKRKWILNANALSNADFAAQTGLYAFKTVQLAKDEETGDLVFDAKKGTCQLSKKPKSLERCRAEKLEQLEAELDTAVEIITKAERVEKTRWEEECDIERAKKQARIDELKAQIAQAKSLNVVEEVEEVEEIQNEIN